MKKHRHLLIALVALFALLAAACGGDDDDAAEEPATTADGEAPAEEPAEEPAPEEPAEQPPAEEPAAEEPAEEPAAEEPAAEEPGGAVDLGSGPADDSLEPVRIGLLNQENDPVGSFPEFRLGVEGAAAYINAELGGIGGRPVEIVSCTHNSIEKAQECSQELAGENLVSVMNGVNIWTIGFDFYGTMGDTPVIGGLPLFPTDYNQPNARYFNGGSISVYAAMARFAAEELGAQKVSVLVNSNPAADAAVDDGLAPIFEQFGVEFSEINVPLPLTDAVPPLSQAAAEDPDLVMLLAAGNECVPVIRAANQLGLTPQQMFYSATCAAEEIYAEVGDLMVGSWMARGGFVAEDPWAPQEVIDLLDQFEIDVDVYAPDAPDAPFTGLGWATMIDVHDVFEEVGADNLDDPANIFAVMDDGQTRGRPGSYGWACTYGDIDLESVCQGDNLFVEIVDADGNSAPPVTGDEYVNGLDLLREGS